MKLLSALSHIGLVIAVIALIMGFQNRQTERERYNAEREIWAWQLLAFQSDGNSGKGPALEYLNSRKHPLQHISIEPKTKGARAVLAGFSLTNSDLSHSRIVDTTLRFDTFEDVSIDQPKSLEGVHFEGSRVSGLTINDANMAGAQFDIEHVERIVIYGADLRASYFALTNLDNEKVLSEREDPAISFHDVSLVCANFQYLNATVEFDNVDLTEAEIGLAGNAKDMQTSLKSAWALKSKPPVIFSEEGERLTPEEIGIELVSAEDATERCKSRARPEGASLDEHSVCAFLVKPTSELTCVREPPA